MSELVKLCTACGSEKLAGPYATNSYMLYGTFGTVKEKSYVCLDCGHVEQYCTDPDLDKIRIRAMKEQEKQYRKRQETM